MCVCVCTQVGSEASFDGIPGDVWALLRDANMAHLAVEYFKVRVFRVWCGVEWYAVMDC